jgi:hypothetical protein
MSAAFSILSCARCHAALPSSVCNSPSISKCPSCGLLIQNWIFPAAYKNSLKESKAEALSDMQDASCFYHPQKKAQLVCAGCGVFICALCDIELKDQHLCPKCIQQGKKKGKIHQLENQRKLYDDIALMTAVVPILFWPISVVTAPVALFLSIRYWKSPTSIVRKSKIRMIFAAIFAVLQIIIWTGFIIVMMMQ